MNLGVSFTDEFSEILKELTNDWIRFTVVCNKADNTFKDAFDNVNYENKCIDHIKNISDKETLRKYKDNIIWSCMKDMINQYITNQDIINQDKLVKVGVLNGESVSENIKLQIGLICPRSKELVEATERNNKIKWVQFRKIKDNTQQCMIYKLSIEKISEEKTYNNLDDLKDKVLRDTSSFNLTDPIIKEELDRNKEIKNFEDFFNSKFQCYIVSEANS